MTQKNKILRKVFKIHSFLGLISGVFLFVLGISGSILVFMEEIDQWANKELYAVAVREHKLPLDQIYTSIVRTYPTIGGIGWNNPGAPSDQAYNFRLYLNDGNPYTYDLAVLTIDPYTGKVLRDGRYDQFRSGIMQWLFQLHFSFHLGMLGAALTAVFGLTMLLSSVTGIIVYRHYFWKVLLFKVRINWKNKRRLASDLHRIVGVWSTFFCIVIFFTGFWMNLFAFEPQSWKKKSVLNPPVVKGLVSMDTLYNRAIKRLPDLSISHIYLPTQVGTQFAVRGSLPGDLALFGQSSKVSIHPVTGVEKIALQQQMTYSEKLKQCVQPLHVGNYGGLLIKVLYVLFGLAPALIALTGFCLYWRRF